MINKQLIFLITIMTQSCFMHAQILTPPPTYIHREQPTHHSQRVGSLPFISGDTFRKIADHFVDELRLPLDINAIKPGDIIFLNTDLLDYFCTEVHPKIKCPYIVLSHNSDMSAPGKYEYVLNDEKIIAWFTVNPSIAHHPKLFPLPIGIANPYWPHGNISLLNSAMHQSKKMQKKHLLWCGFLSDTHPSRREMKRYFSGKHFCYMPSQKKWSDYLLDLAQSQFVLCPQGNGLDCHRMWEALLMGSIPIIKSSTLNSLFEELPVLIVERWEDINEAMLTNALTQIRSKHYNNEKIYAQYWTDAIKNCQLNCTARRFKDPENRTLHIPENFGVDFNASMVASAPQYVSSFAKNDKNWQLIRRHYEDYFKNLKIEESPKIPKIIHQVWVGSPLPKKYLALQKTWKANHPDWQYFLWTDEEVEKLNLVNKKAYDNSVNYGEKSDIVRYEVLYRFGGLYVDTDFECLKPFDIFHHTCDFYSGLASDKGCEMYIALIGAHPGHPILKKCIENINNNGKSVNDSNAIMHRTGPFYFTRCVLDILPTLEGINVLFPSTYFYPWPGSYRFNNNRREIEKWIKPESFGIHHWHVSWNK